MGLYKEESKYITITERGNDWRFKYYTNKQLENFNPKILELGDIKTKSNQVPAIVAIYDLSGFTNFCNQRDPQLCVPEFLSDFLEWLFKDIKREFSKRKENNGRIYWTDLPFFAKFMGDGVLFLWDAAGMQDVFMCNILISLRSIGINYAMEFVEKVKDRYKAVPEEMRCAVTCGAVYSVGNGKDYVGPCINLASRLLKYSNINFSFSRTGFNFEIGMVKVTRKNYIVKSAAIRGMGEKELVGIHAEDFENLGDKARKLYSDI